MFIGILFAGADGRFAEIEKVVEELKTEITTIKTDVAQLSSKQSSAPKSSGTQSGTAILCFTELHIFRERQGNF